MHFDARRATDDLLRVLAALARVFAWMTLILVSIFGSILYAAFGPSRRRRD
jgi:hypothetical protein